MDKAKMECEQYKKKFRKFVEINKINFTSKNEGKIQYSNLQEDIPFKNIFSDLSKHILKIFKIKCEKKSTKIKLFSTDEIDKLDQFGDIIKSEVFYKELEEIGENRVLKLIYKKDETFKNWVHPTILFLICNCISNYYEIKNFSYILITLFTLHFYGGK